MDRKQPLDRLDFEDNLVGYNDVQSVSAIESDAFVNDRQWHLPRESNIRLFEFVAKAFLISGLEKSGAEPAMDLDGEPADPLCELIFLLCVSVPLWFHLFIPPFYSAPVSATRPAASMPATAHSSSRSEVSPLMPTAPMSAPEESRISTPPGTGT